LVNEPANEQIDEETDQLHSTDLCGTWSKKWSE
jgi:hypothetical protein